jgi:hypothetical protein
MNSITDDALKEALHAYAKAICDFIAARKMQDEDPNEFLRKNAGRFIFNERKEVSLFTISNLPEAERFMETIRNHPVVSKQVDTIVGIKQSGIHVTIEDVLLRFMFSLFGSQKGTSFSSSAFGSIFKDMMSFFKSNTIHVQEIIPLENLTSDVDSIDLTDSWKLGKIPDEVQSEWWRQAAQPYRMITTSHLRTRFALLKNHDVERFYGHLGEGGPAELDRLIDEIAIIVSALRLIKQGRVVPRVRTRRVVGWHVGSPLPGISWNPNIPEIPGSPYNLSTDDITELRKVLNELTSAKADKAFQVALSRLNYSVERSDVKQEDRILDSMIGFESLFLGERGELRYRLGLRVAIFLGSSSEERHEIQEFIMRSYNLRSTIIHGYDEKQIKKDLKGLNMDLHQVGLKLEDLLRKALRKYLAEISEGKTRAEILAELNHRILNDASSIGTSKVSPEATGNALIKALRDMGGTPKEVIEILFERKVLKPEE